MKSTWWPYSEFGEALALGSGWDHLGVVTNTMPGHWDSNLNIWLEPGTRLKNLWKRGC